MVVRKDKVIDFLDFRELSRSGNSVCISKAIVRPPRIDQGRLARWRDDQRGLSTFDTGKLKSKKRAE
jgi:hypothetical protein